VPASEDLFSRRLISYVVFDMRLLKIIVGILLVTAFCVFASLAMETKVYTLAERNLSLNGNLGFEVAAKTVENNTGGSFIEDLTITNAQTKGMALVQIMTVYDPTLKALGSDMISQLWMQGALESAATDGANVTGNWTATSNMGEDVAVTSVKVIEPKLNAMGGTVEIANWMIDDDIYAGIMSFFDKNTTKKIIENLEIN
jgi:hypothetical protein